jgi:hypothetical protein
MPAHDPFSDDYDQAEPSTSESGANEPKYKASDFPRMDVTQPSQFRAAVRHVSNVHEAGTPEEHKAGSLWYPKVHDAVAKGAKELGISHLHASGLVAAVSPSMDFDRNNIGAFHEMAKLGGSQWDAIHHSALATPGGKQHIRTPAAREALHGLSLSTAADGALLKAHRIIQGEHPDDVMPARTNPKTNSFMHAIHDPSGSGLTTIDGRAHDIGQNQMWPWEYSGRGISSAALKTSQSPTLASGKPNKRFGVRTRYEHFSDAYHAAAQASDVHPNEMQARTWLTGKRLEKTRPDGRMMQKGASRKRQPYL